MALDRRTGQEKWRGKRGSRQAHDRISCRLTRVALFWGGNSVAEFWLNKKSLSRPKRSSCLLGNMLLLFSILDVLVDWGAEPIIVFGLLVARLG